uniref:BHLH domain-containing protein n=1 Tax=Ditylenchus dipsaci TaxID=166011 RepID=A0A915CTZ6_9BILA
MDYFVDHKLRQCVSTTTSPHLQFYQSDMTKFDAFNSSIPLSSSPPEYPTMERKLKKPMMEKKRRKRMNNCFDALKVLLLQSDLQQSSKLEKADVLEKTQILHTEPGQAFHNGMREGFSVCATATSDVLGRMPLPPPFAAPEFRNMLRQDIGERLATLLSTRGNPNLNNIGSSPPCLPTTSAAVTPADSTLRRMPMSIKKLGMQASAFNSPILPSFVNTKNDGKEVFQGMTMPFAFPPPPFSYALGQLGGDQQQPPKVVKEQLDDFVVVDVESCDAAAASCSQPANDSGISSPPTALSPHNQSGEQANSSDNGQGDCGHLADGPSGTCKASGSLVYRSTNTSSQKKQRKEVWKPYERF